jgi:hypothetical protein
MYVFVGSKDVAFDLFLRQVELDDLILLRLTTALSGHDRLGGAIAIAPGLTYWGN